MPLNGGSTLIPENADSVKIVNGGKIVLLDVINCICGGATITVWKKQKYYYIAFYSNGGAGSMPQQTIPVGTATKLAANLFTRTGYLFAAWATSAAGAAAYSDGQTVTDIAAAGATLALYALWTAITYYIKYNGNGSTGGSMANSTHKYDTAKALTANAYTKTGYQLSGWATSAAGAVTYSNGQTVNNLASANGAVVNLYAVWTAITYYVSYNGNGATGGSMENSTHKYDTAKALTANAYTKDYFAFVGWATSAAGAVTYSNGQSVNNLTSTNGAIVTLYAVWKATMLVNGTDFCTAASGSWYKIVGSAAAETADYYGTVGLIIGGIAESHVCLYSGAAIDVTYLSSCTIDFSVLALYNYAYIGFSDSQTTDGVDAGVYEYIYPGSNQQRTIDLSGLSGKKYFKIVVPEADAHTTIVINSLVCS